MDTCLDPRGSREPGRVVVDIIDGRPWIASRIRNNNLRQHCRMLGRTYRTKNSTFEESRARCRRLLEVIVARSNMLSAIHPSQMAIIPTLVRMAWYGKWWRRAPEQWFPLPGLEPVEQWRSLLEHLFSKGYRLPRFLASAWLTKGAVRHVERTWYCYIAAGISLRRAKNFPQSVTARARHLAMQAPDGFTLRQALRWGQVKALGGSDALVKEVLASRMVHDFNNDRIWLRLLEKLMAAPDLVEVGDFGIIVDLLLPDLAAGRTGHVEQLVSLPLSDLRLHAGNYWSGLLDRYQKEEIPFRHPEIQRAGLRSRLDDLVRGVWGIMPVTKRFEAFHHSKWHWQIHQLTSHLQLIRESKAMKNCVHSHRRLCMAGRSAIFSFRLSKEEGASDAERCFDVEVDPRDRRILQIRNRWNHWLQLNEVPVVREWARRNQLISRWD